MYIHVHRDTDDVFPLRNSCLQNVFQAPIINPYICCLNIVVAGTFPGLFSCLGSFQIVTTGTQTSKQGPVRVRNVAGLNGHQKLLHFIAGSLYIRNLVSRQRRRMLIAGYDLDMSYITDRLLAMSFPAEHMRAMYRNPLWQVRDVLEMKHPGHYKVLFETNIFFARSRCNIKFSLICFHCCALICHL